MRAAGNRSVGTGSEFLALLCGVCRVLLLGCRCVNPQRRSGTRDEAGLDFRAGLSRPTHEQGARRGAEFSARLPEGAERPLGRNRGRGSRIAAADIRSATRVRRPWPPGPSRHARQVATDRPRPCRQPPAPEAFYRTLVQTRTNETPEHQQPSHRRAARPEPALARSQPSRRPRYPQSRPAAARFRPAPGSFATLSTHPRRTR